MSEVKQIHQVLRVEARYIPAEVVNHVMEFKINRCYCEEAGSVPLIFFAGYNTGIVQFTNVRWAEACTAYKQIDPLAISTLIKKINVVAAPHTEIHLLQYEGYEYTYYLIKFIPKARGCLGRSLFDRSFHGCLSNITARLRLNTIEVIFKTLDSKLGFILYAVKKAKFNDVLNLAA